MGVLYYVRLKDDKHNRRYKVKEATSLRAVVDCIHHAQATGSIGGVDMRTDLSGPERREIVTARVVQVNSDLTERQAYTMGY